jgi:hypothetical protein
LVTSETIARAATEVGWDEATEFSEAETDPEAAKEGKAKLRKRLNRHNVIVRNVAKLLESEKAELFENPFDCLACFRSVGILIEVKSLDGTEKDEIARVRDALAQLLYYESFVTEPVVRGRTVKKVACFEHKVSEAHIEWLQKSDILTIWQAKARFEGSGLSRKALAGHLGF